MHVVPAQDWPEWYTLYKKPPDPGLCLELCQHCACLFHVHVFVQVRGIPAGHTMSILCSWTWPHSGQDAIRSVYRNNTWLWLQSNCIGAIITISKTELNMNTASYMSVNLILRAIPAIHEINALREVFWQWLGKFLLKSIRPFKMDFMFNISSRVQPQSCYDDKLLTTLATFSDNHGLSHWWPFDNPLKVGSFPMYLSTDLWCLVW